MKNILLLITFTITGCFSFGQTNIYHPFPDSNAVWIQSNDGWFGTACWIYHDQNLYISGDTTFGNYTYHKLYLNEYVSEFCSPPNDPFPPYYNFGEYYGAFRQDIPNKKVYFYQDGLQEPDVLAYDYNLNVGDTLPLTCLNTFENVFVYNIDSVLVGSQYNKRFWLTNGWSYGYPALIEGLGDTYGAFGYFTNPTNEWYLHLWCVKLNNVTVWKDDTSSTCSIITKVENLEKQIQVSAFPNPFSEYSTIRTNKDLDNASLSITNTLGKEVKKIVNISGRNLVIQRDNLPSGVYLICLVQENKIIANIKVIILN